MLVYGASISNLILDDCEKAIEVAAAKAAAQADEEKRSIYWG